MSGNVESRVTFVGDLTVDNYSNVGKTHLGGASLNGAIWALRTGSDRVGVIAGVGSDEFGQQYLTKAKEEHVDGNGIKILPGKTSSIEIFVSGSGERSWGPWDAGVLEQYHLGNEEFDLLRLSRAASLTIYGKTAHLLSELAGWGREAKTRPMLAVNFDDLSQFGRSLKIVTEHIDGFDAAFFGLEGKKDKELIKELRNIAHNTGKLMVITLGKLGAVAFAGNKIYKSPAEWVNQNKIKDTTGAGDAFLAAFIVTYLKTSGDIRASLVAGNHFGAKKIQILGAY